MAERPQPFGPRFKVGLETPLEGRYVGENKRLVFAPPRWYEGLLLGSIGFGAVLALTGLAGWSLPFGPDATWRLWTGLAVALAGGWAALSHERLTVDLRVGTYARREGKGPLSRVVRGRLDELDALVLLAESKLGQTGSVVVYRLVLHWRGSRHPLLVVSSETRHGARGPNSTDAARLLSMGATYARSLGLPFYDNSHFHSPAPLTPV
ncbi:MAG: hypothetical protein JSS66_02655 [Armatimonadetes bacterium]|nr:hypothetical protein [Armatimonadota bacterium]